MMTATYSPEDNKLRLSSATRLDKELYNRVKSAGFIWAPKQGIFVAPAWSPDREDLLIELCGEIDDEDTSLVDRAEQRADRFEGYRENRTADAEQAHAAVSRIADGIPLGQPILVGHHSERHARRDAEKIENGMRKAVKMWDTAEYWKHRAAGALRHAKYKERPDVRARRIKTIEADMRREIASYTPDKKQGAILQEPWNLKFSSPDLTPEQREAEREAARTPHVWCGQSRGGHWVPVAALEGIKARAARWIQHYENRLTYERAMLEEGGGLAADQLKLEIGGQVCRKGQWFIVTGLNRRGEQLLSVSVIGHWAGTIPIEEIKDYRPPAEGDAEKVKKATTKPPLCNFDGEGFKSMTMAEWKHCTSWSGSSYVSNFGPDGKHTYGRVSQGETPVLYRQRSTLGPGHTRVPVFITDSKVVPAPPAAAAYQPVAIDRPAREVPEYTPKPIEPEAQKFDQLRDSLKAGVQVVSANQLFPTPPDVAARMVDLAEICDGDTILEPSAGTGRIVDALDAVLGTVTAIEINNTLADNLRIRCNTKHRVICADFLQVENLGQFDAILMNPPFENGSDIKHIQRALTLLAPGGRLVAICANGPRQNAALREEADTWEELPEGTFAGTGVRTVLLTMHRAHENPNPLKGEADREYSTRIDAERVTLELAQASTKRVDGGRQPIEDSPLFGGARQGSLFA